MSFAYHCMDNHYNVRVLEKSTRPGGCLHTARLTPSTDPDTTDNNVSGAKQQLTDNFWLELGAHSCYNSYRGLIALIEGLYLKDQIIPRQRVPFRLLRDGKLNSIFKELNLLELLISIPRIAFKKKEGQTVESYYSALLGTRNYQRVMRYFLAAVPSQIADNFPATILFKKKKRRKDIIKSFTMAGGLQTIIDAITSHDRIEICPDSEASSIKKTDNIFEVHLKNGTVHRASQLVIATPPTAANSLLKNLSPTLSEKIGTIKTATTESVGVAIPHQKLILERLAGIIPVDDIFFSAVSRDTVPDSRMRGFTFHFKPGHSQESKIARITKVLDTKEQNLSILDTKTVEMPSPELGHTKIISEIDELTRKAGLYLVGNYFDGLSIEDCVQRSVKEFYRLRSNTQ